MTSCSSHKNCGFEISEAKYSMSSKKHLYPDSGQQTSQLFLAAWKQWSITRLSASSWDEHSECTIDDSAVTPSLLVKQVHCSAETNGISLPLRCSTYSSSSHDSWIRVMKFLLLSSLDKRLPVSWRFQGFCLAGASSRPFKAFDWFCFIWICHKLNPFSLR